MCSGSRRFGTFSCILDTYEADAVDELYPNVPQDRRCSKEFLCRSGIVDSRKVFGL